MALRSEGSITGLSVSRSPFGAAAGAWSALVLADLAGWVWLARSQDSILSPVFCGSPLVGWVSSGWSGAEAALVLNPPARLVMPWLAMVWAMMTPLLARPIAHVWTCGPARLRPTLVALFIASYAAIWLFAGFLLMGGAVALEDLAGAAALPAPALAVAAALLWQTSPLKQACLNGCHRLPRLRPPARAAAGDCLRYGATTALWCVGSCWALMLALLVVDQMHFALMAIVAAVLFVERQAPERLARWRCIPLWRFRTPQRMSGCPDAADRDASPLSAGGQTVAGWVTQPSFVSRIQAP